MRRNLLFALLLVLLGVCALTVAGCGGAGKSEPSAGTVEGGGDAGGATDTAGDDEGETGTGGGGGEGDSEAGEAIFTEQACGGCHTLEAAGSSGTIGPNLDESKPDFDLV